MEGEEAISGLLYPSVRLKVSAVSFSEAFGTKTSRRKDM